MTAEARSGLSIAAADGTRLATDLFRPTGEGPWPTILLRTYLGKARHSAEALGWVRQGFACAVQDVRGRHGSGGDWRPYAHERSDGRAAVRWLVDQPWCDGRIVAVGGSYGAFAAWSAALSHRAVRAVVSAVPAMRPMPLQPEDGGVLPLLSRIAWWSTHAGSRRPRLELTARPDPEPGQCEQSSPEPRQAPLERTPEALEHLPVVDLPHRLRTPLPGWREAILGTEGQSEAPCSRGSQSPRGNEGSQGDEGSQSDETAITDSDLASLDVAAFHVGGWHDPFCAETLHHFEQAGRALDPRPPRALVLGPWWHRLDPGRPASYGERRYGKGSRFPLGAFQARWLQRALAGEAASSTRRIFLCGENRWLVDPDWSPRDSSPRDSSPVRLYAAAGGLGGEPATIPGQASFVHDPRDPRPCRRTPLDENDLPRRRDAVLFETPVLDRPCPILGTPRVVVWGSTEGRSADWVARLLEVTAEGRRLYLAHGVVDAGRALVARGMRLEPGAAHRVVLRLSPLGITVPAGSRLRLELAGSAFPSYARNLGSGEPRLTGTRLVAARQTVYWGANRGTRIELPSPAALSPAWAPAALGGAISRPLAADPTLDIGESA